MGFELAEVNHPMPDVHENVEWFALLFVSERRNEVAGSLKRFGEADGLHASLSRVLSLATGVKQGIEVLGRNEARVDRRDLRLGELCECRGRVHEEDREVLLQERAEPGLGKSRGRA
jgi:hypothetical protein